jgi:phage tail sheath gpL-like
MSGSINNTAGAVAFQSIPNNLRIPLFFAEVNNSQANSAPQTQRALLVGQITASASVPPGVPVLISGNGYGMFGKGSMLASMVAWYRKRDGFGEVWALPLADPSGGVAASGTVTINAPATAAGTLSLYVSGHLCAIPVQPTQTPTQVATALAAVINTNPKVQVTAAAAAGVVTVTANHKGATGNSIDLRLNYLGVPGGEAVPAGLVVNIAGMAGGTGVPDVVDALAVIGTMGFDFLAVPYTDTGSLQAVTSFLADRWSWDKMLYGGAFTAYQGTVAALATFGNGLNDPHLTVMGYNGSPSAPWAWAANYCGASAVGLRADPGLPLQTLQLDVLAPPAAQQFVPGDRNTLLWDGISTFTVGPDGSCAIEQAITTYQTDAYGDPDNSYLYVERLYTIAACIRYLRSKVQSTFGRVKLADSGTNVTPGSGIVTTDTIRSAIIAWYGELVSQGLAQEAATFAANLVVVRNGQNRCRVDGMFPIVPIDALRQLCALVEFQNSTGN